MNTARLSYVLAMAVVAWLGCAPAPEPVDVAPVAAPAELTPLEEYVAAPDPAYAWTPVAALEGDGVTAHVLELTSQSWLTSEEVDRTVWKHWLTVFVPADVAADTGFLYITGGDNDDPAPSEIDPRFAALASATGSVVSELRMVPNQPLTFTGDPTVARKEDALIAYGWDKFLRGGPPAWLARLPMTKAAVRAMDAVGEFMAMAENGASAIDKFVVAGGSKRGWTTWTTAVVDPRVVAIVPLVIDLLNIEASFDHHFRAYGFWAPAVRDYQDKGLMDWLGTAENRALYEIVEPYEYRDRLNLPKLLINASGDQFFLPDSSQFYFADLVGEKHLRYVPNTGHSLRGTDAFDSLMAFYDSVVRGVTRPDYSWERVGEAGLQVRVDPAAPPSEVLLWQATNSEARDFRVDTIGPAYNSEPLTDQGDGVFVAEVAEPAQGWTAFFVELTYPSGADVPFKFTTEVRVVPETLPFDSPIPATAAAASAGAR